MRLAGLDDPDMLGADTKLHRRACTAGMRIMPAPMSFEIEPVAGNAARQDVHFRRADELGNEQVVRTLIELPR